MHPSDEQLQSLLDGETSAADGERIRHHLTGCAACSARWAELEQSQRQADDLLRVLDSTPPDVPVAAVVLRARRRPAQRRSLLAAAAAGLLLAGAAAAAVVPGSPLREYVSRLLAGSRSEAPPRGVAAPPALPPQAAPQSGVAFSPRSNLEIAFRNAQNEGVIRVRLEDGPQVRFRTDDGPVAYALAGDSLWVDNSGASSSYEISIPRGLPRVRVRVADRTVLEKHGDRISGGSATGGGDVYVVSFPSLQPRVP